MPGPGTSPELGQDDPGHPLPQASAYLKQNKYQQAEELYKEILSREDLPAPLGEPQPRCSPPPGGSSASPLQCPHLFPSSPQHRHSR